MDKDKTGDMMLVEKKKQSKFTWYMITASSWSKYIKCHID